MTAHDQAGKEVAEWKSPVLSLHAGKVTIKFLEPENEQTTVVVSPICHDGISEVCLPTNHHHHPDLNSSPSEN